MKDELMKYSEGCCGMSATLILIYILNKLNIFTPQLENYWLVLLLAGITCFIICIVLRIIAVKKD